MRGLYKNVGEALARIMFAYKLATRSYNPGTFDRDSFTEQISTLSIMETNWNNCKEAMKRTRQQFGESGVPVLFSLDNLISTLKEKLFGEQK